jgi:hypothetical protein
VQYACTDLSQYTRPQIAWNNLRIREAGGTTSSPGKKARKRATVYTGTVYFLFLFFKKSHQYISIRFRDYLRAEPHGEGL